MRSGFKLLAIAVCVYLVLSATLFGIMKQPPERFARFAAHMPGPLFMLLPFEPLWKMARGGHLHIGDPAPDFDLPTVDKTARVRLSAFRGDRPVVLVFGSYT